MRLLLSSSCFPRLFLSLVAFAAFVMLA